MDSIFNDGVSTDWLTGINHLDAREDEALDYPGMNTNDNLRFGSLDMSCQERDLLKQAADRFIDTFSAKQATTTSTYPNPDSAQIKNWLNSIPDQHPIGSTSELCTLFETLNQAFQSGIETSAGNQLSYIPGNGLPSSAMGRYLAALTNRYTGMSSHCPGAVALEQSVINWMTNLFGLGNQAGGVLLSGGSIANFTATVVARNQLGDNFHNGTVYISDNAHHSTVKACRLAGIAAKQIRRIPSDGKFKLDTQKLEQALQHDVSEGLQPMMIVATAGTTDSGAIDPLDKCATLAQRYHAWFHIDAAYGGFFVLTERGKKRLSGIDRADSITVDAHKSLFMPFGIGSLLVSDRNNLKQCNSEWGSYLPELESKSGLPDFCSLGPELTRPNRGLEMWLPLKLHGTKAFAHTLDDMLDLTAHTCKQLNELNNISVLNEPELSVICFNCNSGENATVELMNYINNSASVHVSSTRVQGTQAIRLAFLSYDTNKELVNKLMSLIKEWIADNTSSDKSVFKKFEIVTSTAYRQGTA